MGQTDIFDFLQKARQSGDDRYYSISEIYRKLIDMKKADIPARNAIWRSINRLKRMGYLEVQTVGGWPSYMRLKEKYVSIKMLPENTQQSLTQTSAGLEGGED